MINRGEGYYIHVSKPEQLVVKLTDSGLRMTKLSSLRSWRRLPSRRPIISSPREAVQSTRGDPRCPTQDLSDWGRYELVLRFHSTWNEVSTEGVLQMDFACRHCLESELCEAPFSAQWIVANYPKASFCTFRKGKSCKQEHWRCEANRYSFNSSTRKWRCWNWDRLRKESTERTVQKLVVK